MGLKFIVIGLLNAILDIVCSLDDITNNFSELRGVHCDFLVSVSRLGALVLLVGEHTDVVSELASGGQVVTRDEMKVDSGFLGLLDNIFDAASDGVAQDNQGKEGLVLLEGGDLLVGVDFT